MIDLRKEREQKQHVREIIATGYEQIRDTQPISDQETVVEVSVDFLRVIVFENILRDLDHALSRRTDHVGYKQRYELESILITVPAFMNEMKAATGNRRPTPTGLKFYEQHFFEKIREIDWLAEAAPKSLE